jgi:hypothetical protein
MLFALPPKGSAHVTLEFSWGWGLYASALAGALGILVAARFGGPLPKSSAAPQEPAAAHARTSRGETLH